MTRVEAELSRFVAEAHWDDLPASIRTRVTDIWVDAVANALAGRHAANTAAVERLAGRLTGGGDSVVIGGGTSSLTGAALLNGFQITAYTMCDVYRPALCHITPEVVPAVLAVAGSGHDLLTGLAVGLEVTARLGLGVDYPTFRRRGWHAPGVIGTIGAAAAAARALGLGDREVRGAMGLGASQAAGTFAALGTPAVKFHQARGAVSGLWSAMFAADGLGGSQRGLTHEDGGLLSTYADGGRPEAITEGLGDRWELEQISLRRWPAASSLQSLIAALLETPTAVRNTVHGVHVSLPPVSYSLCADAGWSDELTAMQSARYVTAVVLSERRCWTEQFGADRRADRYITGFAADQVTVSCSEDLPPAGVQITLTGDDGTEVTVRRDTAPGDPTEPLSRAHIIDKLGSAESATAVVGENLKKSLVDTVRLSGPAIRDSLRASTSAERTDREFACRS